MRSRIIQAGGTAALMLAGMGLAAGLTAAQTQITAQTPLAQIPASDPIVRFTGTTQNVAGARDAIQIELLRWSTDAERTQMAGVWTQAVARAAALAAARAKGGAPEAAAGGRGGRGGAAGGRAARPADPDDGTAGLIPPSVLIINSGQPTPSPLTPEGSLFAALDKAPIVGYLWSSEVSGYAVRYAARVPQPDGSERVILITDRRLGALNGVWKPTGPAAADNSTANDYEFSVIEMHLNAKGEGEGKASLTGKVDVDAAAKVIALENYAAQPVILKGVAQKNLGKS